jgi:hypothetical protein
MGRVLYASVLDKTSERREYVGKFHILGRFLMRRQLTLYSMWESSNIALHFVGVQYMDLPAILTNPKFGLLSYESYSHICSLVFTQFDMIIAQGYEINCDEGRVLIIAGGFLEKKDL